MEFFTIFSILAITPMSSCAGVIDEEHTTSNNKCQFGKSPRKQIDVTSLNGVCLRDMVVHLSKHLRNITDEELGATLFQGMLGKLNFVDSVVSLKARLDEITKNFNGNLKKYTDILSQSHSLVQPILAHKDHGSHETNQLGNRPLNICSRITDALSMEFHSQDWKNLDILPVSRPGTMCGPPSLAHNIGPLLLSQCNRSKNVILLVDHYSGFMSDEDVTHAQIIAKTIVHMLSDTDCVTVIGLAGSGSAMCPEQGLPQATDIHKIRLDEHIDSLDRSSNNQIFKVNVADFVENISGDVILIHLTNNMKDSSTHDLKLPNCLQAQSATKKTRNRTMSQIHILNPTASP
ncbi:hypothetical protein QAD02_000495 [Eretmocerus hayati]|uniref:Uncharacterized protein n=1 Tax=Eretmocerus hayati TaxID=131215 RepID=A0ACC2NF27_9HYME|nr:hypothetical protein QAD02_000495 [Eretmocerus hayati]